MNHLNAPNLKLVSIDKTDTFSRMNEHEKLLFRSQTKKQAGYMMLTVSRAMQAKDYVLAKNYLIYIADSCSCVEEQDAQVRYLIEVCCQHLALIFEKQKENNIHQMEANTEINYLTGVQCLRYNKFAGQFKCDLETQKNTNPKVLFYISKLNAILFSYQNSQNVHSFIAMLRTYVHAFILVFLLIAILVLSIFSKIQKLLSADEDSFLAQLPIIAIGGVMIFPLLIIYIKEPFKKDKAFFEVKLGEEIKKINETCKLRGQKIHFKMPQGIQINVQVGE